MSPHFRAMIAAILAAAATPWLAGCAEEPYDREAAYPQQPVGSTLPPSAPPEGDEQSALPPPPPPAPPRAPVVIGAEPSEGASPGATAPDDAYPETDPSALQDFRGALDPYGSWVDDPTYGTVWVPSASVVGSDFTPYVSAGHWGYDQDEYVWVSDYDWGWAPFHYGRWVYGGPGWSWIPGRRYAGAWVSWRYGVGDWGYVGWAPLAPTWGWRGGAAFSLGFTPRMPYSFCASGDLFAPRIAPAVVTGPQVGVIAANTRPWTGSGNGSWNGRVRATPGVGGPPPAVLRIPASTIATTGANRGVLQARAFATPRGSVALGGSAPRGVRAFSTPVYREPAHFGGRLGTGFTGAGAANAPGYANVRPYYGAGGISGGGTFPRSGYGYGRGANGFSAYRGQAGRPVGASGSFHGGGGAAPRASGGFHGGGGGGRGGGRR